MEKYVNQLIEDLNAAASRPPASPFVEPPPHLEDDPFTVELALVPFKSIEWLEFKKAWMEAHVAELLMMNINSEGEGIF